MISVQMKDNQNFMNTLLSTQAFDTFLLKEAQITTFVSYLIDGHSTDEEIDGYVPFSQIRTILFDLIKGKKPPQSMKLILHLKESSILSILEKGNSDLPAETIKSFVLTIKYSNQEISLVTATAYQSFTLDKTADTLWDQALIRFLEYHNLSYH